MGAGKKIVAGAIIGGGGIALERIGTVIFSATGTAEGPFVNYQVLMEMSSTTLIVLGAIITVYGILEGIYRLRENGEEEEQSTRSRSRNAPSSPRDRPRNPSRS